MIIIQSKLRKLANIANDFPNAHIVDVTSKADMPMVKFSPFYPIGGIPVPFSDGVFAESVEGIWQGLKVFDKHDVDVSKFTITNMKGIKRTVRRFGQCKGHRKGLDGAELLDYISARKLIYIPTYQWVLEHKLADELAMLHELSHQQDLVLLDYETNGDINDPSKPLSHAQLIKMVLELDNDDK